MDPPNGEVKTVGGSRRSWRPDENIEIRRPQIVSASSEPSHADTGAHKYDETDKPSSASQSNLSVNAKEFVPRAPASTTFSEESRYFGSSSNVYCGYNEQDEYDFSSFSDESAMLHLFEVIENLTLNPGSFELLVEPLLNELLPLFAVEETVENVVLAIMNQAIAQRNFRYSGARLCNLINNQKEEGSAFRRILIHKLTEEQGKIETNLSNNSDQVYGLVHFLAELFIQLETTKGCGLRIAVLGDALLLALKVLIQIPSVDNIKHTCDILKLSGRMLDADHSDADSFFSDLQKLHDDASLETRVQGIIGNILKLRSDNWGHSVTADNASTSTASLVNESNVANGVYYGPDHQALTAEEYKFLDELCDGDETVSVGDDSTVWDPDVNDHENAEIMAAFQEFINQKPAS